MAAGRVAAALVDEPSPNACEPIVRDRPRPDPEPWTPPHDADELSDMLSRLKGWTPFDVSALLDVVADALDDLPPTAMDMPDLLHRLHSHLGQLANISIANEASKKDADVARLLLRGETLRASPLPADPAKAQGHLRQVGWVVNGLVERLVEAQYMKGTE